MFCHIAQWPTGGALAFITAGIGTPFCITKLFCIVCPLLKSGGWFLHQPPLVVMP
jgi:hypothetical protein